MNTVRTMLRDADPLRDEPQPSEAERDRLRRAVAAAAYRAPAAAKRSRVPLLLLVTAALIILAAVGGSRLWPHGVGTVQAAVRFEVRLAEDQAAAGLRAARVAGSDRMVYLHDDIVVNNDDIESSSLIPGDSPSRFGVGVRFTAAGARRMEQATANHIGKPLALLIDGDVAAAPMLTSAISTSAMISGDFSRAEAERIVNGIGSR